MKSKTFLKYLAGLLSVIIIVTACQDLEEPGPVGDFPLDGPVATFVYPNSNGSTLIQSIEDVIPVTVEFNVNDDLELVSVEVQFNGNSIGSYTDFEDSQSLIINDLTIDEVATGTHVITIIATDSDGNVTTTTAEFTKEEATPLAPQFGEVFYMPFDDNYIDVITLGSGTVVGSPGFAGESRSGDGNAYAGAADAYLTYPTAGLTTGQEFSAAFWLKLNTTPDRAGLLVIGDSDDGERNQGFRLFREGSAASQTIKLNVGTGTGESWNDGGAIDTEASDWAHVAFSISGTESKVYINGALVNTATLNNPIDWTNVTDLSIASGGPSFNYWNHNSDESYLDDLFIFDRAITNADVLEISGLPPTPIFNMPFDGSYEDIISSTTATVVGSPGFAGESQSGEGDAYAGAPDAYLTFSTDGLLTDEFSASFWYKLNDDPDRAGVLVIGPPDESNPDSQNNRSSGFRFFRESAGDNQRFKLNVGTGLGDNWFDGGAAADVDPASNEWVHLAFTISQTESIVYINGEVVSQGEFDGVDWTNCDIMSIMSGDPRFTGWNHLSDNSYMDQLQIFNVVLTPGQIETLMAQ